MRQVIARSGERAVAPLEPQMRPFGSLGRLSPDLGAAGDLAHLAALVILDRLHELRPRVHHERAVARHRLTERNATEQEKPARTAGSRKANGIAGAENGELTFLEAGAVRTDSRRTLEYIGQHAEVGREGDGGVGPGLKGPILEDDGSTRLDHGADAERLAGDHSNLGPAVARVRLRQLLARVLLVAWPDQLVPPGQVHPDLEAVHPAALLANPPPRPLL